MLESSAIQHFRYSAVVSMNDMAYPAKSVAMNVRFDADCIGLFKNHSVRMRVMQRLPTIDLNQRLL